MTSRIPDGPARRAFALAGDATFTIVGRESRFTYRVRRAPEKRNCGPLWFVSVLTGGNNAEDYTYFGTLRHETRDQASPVVFSHGLRGRITKDAPSAVAFAWAWPRLDELDRLGAEFWHAGACGKCGRTLTDPASLVSGLGPICAGRLGAA